MFSIPEKRLKFSRLRPLKRFTFAPAPGAVEISSAHSFVEGYVRFVRPEYYIVHEVLGDEKNLVFLK